jgi:hypothetical protein
MENLKLPAYPHTIYERVGDAQFVATTDANNPGFTKLEMDSLMIAQGMAANQSYNELSPEAHARLAAMVAKDVLEAANK